MILWCGLFSFGCVPISSQKNLVKREATALLSWKRTTASRLPCYFHHYNPENNWLNNLLVGWLTDTQLPRGTQLSFVCLGPGTSFYLHHSRFLSASFASPFCPMDPSCLFILVWILFKPLAQSLLQYFFSTLLVLFLSKPLHCRLVPSFLMGAKHSLVFYPGILASTVGWPQWHCTSTQSKSEDLRAAFRWVLGYCLRSCAYAFRYVMWQHCQALPAQAKRTAAKCFYVWGSVGMECVLSNSSSIIYCMCGKCSYPSFGVLVLTGQSSNILLANNTERENVPSAKKDSFFQTGWDLLPKLKADSCLSGRNSMTTSPRGLKHSCVSWIFIVNIHPHFTLSVGGGASIPVCSP